MTDDGCDVPGVVVAGHGAASGASGSYPGGTLALQIPHFLARGLDLRGYHLGTINVDISPLRFVPRRPAITVRDVAWTDRIPPEDFSFFPCELEHAGVRHDGLVYYPHPETKVEHFQNESIVEVLSDHLAGLAVGDTVVLRFPPDGARAG